MTRGRGFAVLNDDAELDLVVEPDPAMDPNPGPEPGRSDSGDRGRVPLLLPALFALVGLVVAAIGLTAWWRATHDDRATRAALRDTVLIAATQDIETMNSLDYQQIDKGLARWQAVTTGTLHDQLTQVSAADRKLLAQQHKISTGKVLKAAVVDLDDGTATVIASVEVTVRDGKDASADPTVKRNRFTADLVRTGGTWKLESLDQVAVSMQ